MAEHDVIVVGAGHNGLIVAGYLAKSGLNVQVVERLDYIGGGCITKEVTLPGFKHDLFSIGHVLIQANPLIANDELKLKDKYGLQYFYPEINLPMVFPDGRALIIYLSPEKTAESIEQFSKKDAENYYKFYNDWASPVFDVMMRGMYSPPPPIRKLDFAHGRK